MDYKKILSNAAAMTKKPGGWFAHLSVQQVKEMILLRAAYTNIEAHKRPSVEALRKTLSEELGLKIGKDSFREWLTQRNSSSEQLNQKTKTGGTLPKQGKKAARG